MIHALRVEHQVVEGGGAVAVGALLHGKLDVRGRTAVAVVSGGNADMGVLARLLTQT
jgi:threonine dehydratase